MIFLSDSAWPLLLLWIGTFFVLSFWCLFGKVRPLTASLPYRWGMWKGLGFGLVAFALAAGAAVEFTEATKPIDEVLRGAVLAAAGALICAVVSLGLLRRRRYGVVLQFLVEGLAAVLYLTMYSQPQTVDWGLLRKLIALISYFFSTGTYFAKRWPFMASLRNPNSSAPAQETGETHSS